MNYKKIYKDKEHSGAYLFYGKEKYLIENAVIYLINKYVKGTEAFNYTKFKGSEVKPEDIISACETYPVMNEKKIVIVRDVCDFLSENNIKNSFYDFLDNISDFVILIFWDTANIKKTTKFYKEFKKKDRDIEFGKLSQVDLNNFVKGYFIRKGKEIGPSETSFFIAESGYNSKNEDMSLLDLKTEMDKIVSLSGEKRIKRDDIEKSITENIDSNIFKFLDAMMNRNSERAIIELNNLYKLNEPSLKIFTMIIRQVKNFLSYKILSVKKMSQSEIIRKMDVKKYEYGKIQSTHRNFTKEFLTNFYEELIDADQMLKTSSIDEKIIMETLVIKYCNDFNFSHRC
ncbi:MAG: DNA polymerase III subunit delta [Peptoniphilus lacydonensis]|jgi:DNA polymerase III, delta subunit|uniref:DNA polymerase III subunit delta n=1 Tax=Peptoniphilus TaxID=162289 RepID=UPI000288F63B|nr:MULTISPECIES: DNA polymerase III subunit delta [Peptoniphilus]MDU1953960.1 DNA polymerase III subunit delta [Peptoniphilus lacydonensis]MDU5275113.1 DNA polymerase III subunit delta [Peptoniphilus lacydonensis]MDU7302005.1 DNA polymerase III subunit delta [Peptoniphilus lacydonensis]